MSVGTYADLLRALGQNESGNSYSFVSSVGYLGRFQFSEEALQAIGFYHGDGTHALDFVGGWTDKAHSLGVWDKTSFLATPGAQDAAQDAWFQKVWEDATSLNLQSYIGQWVAGVEVSPSGLLAGAHLVGVWNLKSWLETGGAVDTRDPYGTPVSQYVGKFGGYDTPFSGPSGGGQTGGQPGGPTGGQDTAGQVLAGGDWADQLHGGAGADTISGGGGENLLRGHAGDDSLQGGWGFDDLHGNTGADTVAGGGGDDWVVGGQDNDLLFGEDGADVVLGNLGADRVDGGGGDDVVRGGQADDSISGGWGDDWLSGDRGSDTISGGAGADVFHVFEGSNADLVLDFNVWEGDRVDAAGNYWVSQTDQGVAIDLADARMILQGVQLSSLPDGWIF